MMEVTVKARGHRTLQTKQNRLLVRRLRVFGGKSGTEIAKALGMTRQQVSAIESGDMVRHKYPKLRSVAEVMGLTDATT